MRHDIKTLSYSKQYFATDCAVVEQEEHKTPFHDGAEVVVVRSGSIMSHHSAARLTEMTPSVSIHRSSFVRPGNQICKHRLVAVEKRLFCGECIELPLRRLSTLPTGIYFTD